MEHKCFKTLFEYRERQCRCHNGADIMCGGRLFQKVAPETGKARLPTCIHKFVTHKNVCHLAESEAQTVISNKIHCK